MGGEHPAISFIAHSTRHPGAGRGPAGKRRWIKAGFRRSPEWKNRRM